jgi:aspartate racemase
MKLLGLIGGMSPESTVPYYRLLNRHVGERLGGLHSARLLLYSVDFADIAALQAQDRWAEAGELLADAARRLRGAGAQAIVLCTNTMHEVAPAIEAAVDIPLLHIADPTAAAIRAAGLERIGLLGTRFTMERDFYRGRLARVGIATLVPDADGRERVHRAIYDELCRGVFAAPTRAAFVGEIRALVERGAQGIVFGCTEIGLLLGRDDCPVPSFDTAALHAQAAVDFALAPD